MPPRAAPSGGSSEQPHPLVSGGRVEGPESPKAACMIACERCCHGVVTIANWSNAKVVKYPRVLPLGGGGSEQPQPYLTESVYTVCLQKSVTTQISQLVL